MSRSAEERKYHAAKERDYRSARRAEREAAIARFSEAVATLRRAGYSHGQLLDLMLAVAPGDAANGR